jgi:hypothetical protein
VIHLHGLSFPGDLRGGAVTRVEVGGDEFFSVLVVRAEDPEPVEGVADERVSLVNMG